MEIRRVDPELIPPTVASDHSARAEMDRRPVSDRRQRGKRQHHDAASEQQGEQMLADEHHPAHATTYSAEGHLEERDLPHDETHRIDFIV
ncbi:MAG: hypothetical protein ACYDBB_07000 [Armatimonadota bacterium]